MNSREFLLTAIGSQKAAPSTPRVLLVSCDEGGKIQVTEGGRIVPDGSIDPNAWTIWVTEAGADQEAIKEAENRVLKG